MMKKQIISTILVLTTFIGLIPNQVFAESFLGITVIESGSDSDTTGAGSTRPDESAAVETIYNAPETGSDEAGCPPRSFLEQNGLEVAGCYGATETGSENPTASGSSDSTTYLNDGGDTACYSNAGALGWIICPAITMLSAMGSQLYGWVEENYLKVPAQEIFTSSNSSGQSPTYIAWSTFRDIANIMFVILFLLVIFSQLTGYGIDNYGIKRMLPRIIIAAILINLSYFICQLATDVANIIGVAMSNLLSVDNFGIFTARDGVADAVYTGTSAVAGIALGVGAVAGIGFMLTFPPLFELGLGIILTLLLALISVVIAILFLWLILVARQAVIVLLIILSPLAFACYILPNTETITKRWLKIAEAILLLYPLCSLVVSGGKLAGSILANMADSQDSSFGLAAMVVQVLPFFAIPVLVKNSMAGLGNLGAKITGLGQRASRGISSGATKAWNLDSMKSLRLNKAASMMSKEKVEKMKEGAKKGGLRGAFYNTALKTSAGIMDKAAKNANAEHTLTASLNRYEAAKDPNQREAIEKDLIKEANEKNVASLETLYDNPVEYDSESLGKELRNLSDKDDQTSINRAKAIQNVLIRRGDTTELLDAHADAQKEGKFSDTMRQALSQNGVAGSASKKLDADLVLKKFYKKNQGAKASKELAENADLEYFGVISPEEATKTKGRVLKRMRDNIEEGLKSKNPKIRKKAQAAADGMARISNVVLDPQGLYYGRLDDDHRKPMEELQRLSPTGKIPSPGSQAPIAKQASGTGQTLEVQNPQGQTPYTVTPASTNGSPVQSGTLAQGDSILAQNGNPVQNSTLPSWVEREARSATTRNNGLSITGEDPKVQLNLPGDQIIGRASNDLPTDKTVDTIGPLSATRILPSSPDNQPGQQPQVPGVQQPSTPDALRNQQDRTLEVPRVANVGDQQSNQSEKKVDKSTNRNSRKNQRVDKPTGSSERQGKGNGRGST